MATAFILLNILPGKGEKIVDALRKMKHVREVYCSMEPTTPS